MKIYLCSKNPFDLQALQLALANLSISDVEIQTFSTVIPGDVQSIDQSLVDHTKARIDYLRDHMMIVPDAIILSLEDGLVFDKEHYEPGRWLNLFCVIGYRPGHRLASGFSDSQFVPGQIAEIAMQMAQTTSWGTIAALEDPTINSLDPQAALGRSRTELLVAPIQAIIKHLLI